MDEQDEKLDKIKEPTTGDTQQDKPIQENIEEPTPIAPEREKVLLEDLNLDVHFEMNRIKTTLGELKNYEAGYVFDFALDADAILLTVNGQVIGKGQLVELKDKVGIRLTEIYK